MISSASLSATQTANEVSCIKQGFDRCLAGDCDVLAACLINTVYSTCRMAMDRCLSWGPGGHHLEVLREMQTFCKLCTPVALCLTGTGSQLVHWQPKQVAAAVNMYCLEAMQKANSH